MESCVTREKALSALVADVQDLRAKREEAERWFSGIRPDTGDGPEATDVLERPGPPEEE